MKPILLAMLLIPLLFGCAGLTGKVKTTSPSGSVTEVNLTYFQAFGASLEGFGLNAPNSWNLDVGEIHTVEPEALQEAIRAIIEAEQLAGKLTF